MMLINVIKYYRQNGFLRFLKRFLDGLGFKYFNRALIFLQLDLGNALNNFNDESYDFLMPTKEDIEKEQKYNDYWFRKEDAIYRLQNGHRLFVLKENGRIVFFLWAEKKQSTISWFDLHMHIPQDMIYITGVYTIPEFRNRGIAYKLKREIFHYLKKEGIKNLIEVVDPSNATALKMDKKIGFREYQIVYYKRYWFIRCFCVRKHRSNQQRTFISVFKTPEIIWKAFL